MIPTERTWGFEQRMRAWELDLQESHSRASRGFSEQSNFVSADTAGRSSIDRASLSRSQTTREALGNTRRLSTRSRSSRPNRRSTPQPTFVSADALAKASIDRASLSRSQTARQILGNTGKSSAKPRRSRPSSSSSVNSSSNRTSRKTTDKEFFGRVEQEICQSTNKGKVSHIQNVLSQGSSSKTFSPEFEKELEKSNRLCNKKYSILSFVDSHQVTRGMCIVHVKSSHFVVFSINERLIRLDLQRIKRGCLPSKGYLFLKSL